MSSPGNEFVTERETEFDRGDVPPNRGGCWFCHRGEGPLQFSWEFDARYHKDCAIKAGLGGTMEPILFYERGRVEECRPQCCICEETVDGMSTSRFKDGSERWICPSCEGELEEENGVTDLP